MLPVCEAAIARAQDQTEGGDTGKVKVPSREVEPVTGVCTVVLWLRGLHGGFFEGSHHRVGRRARGGSLWRSSDHCVSRRSLEFSLSVEQYFFVNFSEQDYSLGKDRDSFDLLDFKEEELAIVSDHSHS